LYYFDTSFLTPLLLEEETSARVEAYVRRLPASELYVSHWTKVEFASLLAREVRTGGFEGQAALEIAARFEMLMVESYEVLTPQPSDYELAQQYVLNFRTALRAGDALHLAIAKNHGAVKLLTLDDGLLKAAKLLAVPASRGIR
jgi:predicted nucleic acid-binding protein